MRKIFVQTFIAFLVSLSGHAWAANYNDPIDGTFKGIYGNTISVEVPSLISKSPVTNENENGDLSFQLAPDTGYRNFNQLTDLKYGDPVRIEYNEDPNSKIKKMVAVVITKLEPEIVTNPTNPVNADIASSPTVTQTVTTTTTKVNPQ